MDRSGVRKGSEFRTGGVSGGDDSMRGGPRRAEVGINGRANVGGG